MLRKKFLFATILSVSLFLGCAGVPKETKKDPSPQKTTETPSKSKSTSPSLKKTTPSTPSPSDPVFGPK